MSTSGRSIPTKERPAHASPRVRFQKHQHQPHPGQPQASAALWKEQGSPGELDTMPTRVQRAALWAASAISLKRMSLWLRGDKTRVSGSQDQEEVEVRGTSRNSSHWDWSQGKGAGPQAAQ